MSDSNSDDSLVLSFLSLRKAVGIIGISLPFMLLFGGFVFEGAEIERSISHYYYTAVRGIFVGSLFSIAVFLIAYRGYETRDNIAGHLAGGFALIVALFPTKPYKTDPTTLQEVVGYLHMISAGLFLLVLSYFCLRLFRQTDARLPPTTQKLMRNKVYTVCGYTIISALLLIILVLAVGLPQDNDPVFWLESVAVVAFGVSWLTKGESILPDK